jgi:hypothetical protein
MNRREFLHSAVIGTAAVGLSSAEVTAAGVRWQIGCLNRPWTRWPFDQTLKGIKPAPNKTTGLLSRTRDDAFIGAEATPEYLSSLKQRIAAAGLKPIMGALRTRHDITLEDSINDVRKQIDHARLLSLK